MPETPVTDQVDHHVLVEFHPVVEREPRREHDSLGVVTIHVKDRRLDHLGHIAAIERRARIARVADREADLVVDHDVHGAAGVEAPRLRHLQGFHHDALRGKRSIAVQQHGHHLVAACIAASFLPRPHRALDDGVDDLEMRRVERQRHVHVAAGGTKVGRISLVILDVAGALEPLQVVLTFELAEEIRGRLAEHVDQHVEPATVRHADHDVLDGVAAAALDQVVEERNQAIPSLEREPLLRRVLGREIALQAFRHRQLPQDVAVRVRRGVLSHPARLEPVVQPEALGRIRHMRELGADRAAVDVPELREDVAQRKPRLDRVVAAAGVELEIEVRFRQLVILEIEDAWPRPDHEAERIDVRNQVASVHVGLDQARNRSLLRACVVPVGRRCRRCGAGS